jgi:hypothetical protein
MGGAPRRAQTVAALVLYALASLLIFGRGILGGPDTHVVGDAAADKTISMWSFVWWPHAVSHFHDPLTTTAIWEPHGMDLAWAATTPGAALLAVPLTFTAGPVVAYNALALAAPALAAWCAFLLCRYLTGRFWPSLIGGWIFGFSVFEVNQTVGHLHMTLIFLVPFAALLIVRRLRGESRRWRFVVALALVLTFQFLFSTETFSTLVLVAAIFGALAWWRLPDWRGRLTSTGGETLVALVGASVLLLPYLIHAFVVGHPPKRPIASPTEFAADVLNFIVPTRRVWLHPASASRIQDLFRGNGVEQTAYLGPPLIAILLLFGWRARRRREDAVLVLGFLVVALLACGPYIRAAGRVVGLGPWWLFTRLPAAQNALPVRLTMYLWLVAAVIIALWLARGSGLARWALALLAVIAILPNPGRGLWTADVPRTAFFSRHAFERYLRPNEPVLVFPYGPGGWSMLWQAETHFRFHMVGGYLVPRPQEERWRRLYLGFGYRPLPANATALLRRFVAEHRLRWVVVANGSRFKVWSLVESLGVKPISVADVSLYRVSRGPPPAPLPRR